VAVIAVAAWQGRLGPDLYGGTLNPGDGALHPLALLFGLWGSLMISTIRIPKL